MKESYKKTKKIVNKCIFFVKRWEKEITRGAWKWADEENGADARIDWLRDEDEWRDITSINIWVCVQFVCINVFSWNDDSNNDEMFVFFSL